MSPEVKNSATVANRIKAELCRLTCLMAGVNTVKSQTLNQDEADWRAFFHPSHASGHAWHAIYFARLEGSDPSLAVLWEEDGPFSLWGSDNLSLKYDNDSATTYGFDADWQPLTEPSEMELILPLLDKLETQELSELDGHGDGDRQPNQRPAE